MKYKWIEKLFTALNRLDYKEKIIKSFVTNEGSGLLGVPMQLKRICNDATITSGIEIKESMLIR